MGYPSISFTPPDASHHPVAQQRVGMLQALLDGLFEAACIVDGTSLCVIGINSPMQQLFGLSAGRLIGHPVEQIVCSPEDHHFWLAAQDALNAGLVSTDGHASLHSDTLVRHAQGELRTVERRIVPIQLASGHPAWLLTWLDDAPKRALQDELDQLSATWGAAFAASRDALLVTDRAGAVRGCSLSFVQLLGLPADTPATRADLVLHLQQLAAEPGACLARWHASLADGRSSWTEQLPLLDGRVLEWHSTPQYARGELIGRLHVWRDLTPQLQAAARQRLAAEVFDTVADGLLVLDAHYQVLHLNRAARLLCGLPHPQTPSGPVSDWLCDPLDPECVPLALASLDSQGRWDGELHLQSATGPVPVLATLVGVAGSADSGHRYIAVVHDLRERQAQQQALRDMSQSDPLTGLPNRQAFAQQLAQAMSPHGPSQPQLAVVAIGIDRFARINDSLGPNAGDALLVNVAARLRDSLRPQDVLARLGGDTFVLLLPHVDTHQAEAVARHTLATLQERFSVTDIDLSLQSSVGIAVYPGDGHSADELLKNADSAMHHAKRRLGGELRFYQPRMNTELLARMRMDHAMRMALPAHRFELYFQPQYDLQHGGLVGAEALLRWNDPELGQVPPGDFIPVAEETGFIIELGDFVLRTAIAHAKRWLQQGVRIPVAVNISALQFQQAHFAEHVLALLQQQDLPNELLELELTESVLACDLDDLTAQLHRLSAHGVQLAIDDFGTGYASLGYLKQLPLHRLKIDRCFVRGLPEDSSDAAIVRSILRMAHDLKLRVVAEGVETPAQAQFLADLGCHEAQGFLYARPMQVDSFEQHYAQQQQNTAA